MIQEEEKLLKEARDARDQQVRKTKLKMDTVVRADLDRYIKQKKDAEQMVKADKAAKDAVVEV